jgi:zinc transporter ZupT
MEEPVERDTPPTMPSRTAFLLSFVSVVLAGVLGGVIGYGIVDISCARGCAASKLLGAVLGAVLAAAGVGIVAVLVLRAMAEWRRKPPAR